ncbi:N-acetyltransferase family protein [Nocardioides sp. Bht2]|uniref:GNAT family N-acetyltransferase n=1 Tax=Nocardioides sp. Bht2 TaxID=3392297 RepID=UPI0039B5C956
MSRTAVTLREASVEDAEALAELWAEQVQRSMAPVDDMRLLIKQVATVDGDRIVVAEFDGVFAGAVFLRIEQRSPFEQELAVNVLFPCVVPALRRHGVGRALVEAAVQWAENRGITQIRAASTSNSRLAHRFLARLGLGPLAVQRVGATHLVRSRVSPGRMSGGQPMPRSMGALLAQRRRQREGT